MSGFLYSAKQNAFVMTDSSLVGTEEFSDAIEVSEDIFQEFFPYEKDGKRRAPGADGLPSWEDIPGPTEEELYQKSVMEAELQKSSLMAEAATIIAPLQDAVDLEISIADEEAKLKAWKTYRVLLNRIDTSQAPDIKWPTRPD